MTSYEEVLNQINAIPAGITGDDRTITWLTAAQVVGGALMTAVETAIFGLAPTVALMWTGASGAFGGWRLHRKLARSCSPSGAAVPEPAKAALWQAPTVSVVTDPLP